MLYLELLEAARPLHLWIIQVILYLLFRRGIVGATFTALRVIGLAYSVGGVQVQGILASLCGWAVGWILVRGVERPETHSMSFTRRIIIFVASVSLAPLLEIVRTPTLSLIGPLLHLFAFGPLYALLHYNSEGYRDEAVILSVGIATLLYTGVEVLTPLGALGIATAIVIGVEGYRRYRFRKLARY